MEEEQSWSGACSSSEKSFVGSLNWAVHQQRQCSQMLLAVHESPARLDLRLWQSPRFSVWEECCRLPNEQAYFGEHPASALTQADSSPHECESFSAHLQTNMI